MDVLATETTRGTLVAGGNLRRKGTWSADIGMSKGGGSLTKFCSGADLEDFAVDIAALQS